ncbi:peptidyl-prolyl cis-trans isomerase [Camelliibacillus cellulosilyticus]|uniref:Peptidyl-prolyl cis-trans isomerase n=1 Tax=Camelliibacillus cellulosilyticus TaxID=2174486 RepID=A0ABV9GGE1_9BACL
MLSVVPLAGSVKYRLTLDPSSWIFDDRKIALEDFLNDTFDLDAFLEEQADERAGAAMPRLATGRRRYKKEEWLERSFVMPIKIFLKNAEPGQTAKTMVLICKDGSEVTCPLAEAESGVLQFSENGKLLQDKGPLIFIKKNSAFHVNGITEIRID